MGMDTSHKSRAQGLMRTWLVKDFILLNLFLLFIFDTLLFGKLLSLLEQKRSHSNTFQCSPKIGFKKRRTYKKFFYLHGLCIALMDCACLLPIVFKSLSVIIDPTCLLDCSIGSRGMVNMILGVSVKMCSQLLKQISLSNVSGPKTIM